MGGWNKGLTKDSNEIMRIISIKVSERKKGNIPWNKGLTKETDQRVSKMAEALKGKKLSKEHIQKLIQSRKGKLGWCLGLTKETDERIRRIAEKHIGFKHSEEAKKKLSKALKGRVFSKEWREKISKSKKGQRVPLEARIKISQFHKGRKFSEEHKRKISKAMTGENNPNLGKKGKNHPRWIHGRGYEPYNAEFNRQLKDLIRLRDGYKCQKCGCPEIEENQRFCIHHIDYDKQNCLPSDLISLCRRCNNIVNSNRKKWTRYFKNKLKKVRPQQLCLHK